MKVILPNFLVTDCNFLKFIYFGYSIIFHFALKKVTMQKTLKIVIILNIFIIGNLSDQFKSPEKKAFTTNGIRLSNSLLDAHFLECSAPGYSC